MTIRNPNTPIPNPGRPSLLGATLAIIALAVLGLEGTLWARFAATPGYLAQTDFPAWFATARLIASGQSGQIFNVPVHQAMQDALIAPYQTGGGGLVYHYWPVLGGLLLPLAGGSLGTALTVWVLGSALAFTAALILLVYGLRFRLGDGVIFGLAAWSFLPHIVDLEQGQTSNLLCLPLAFALLALRRGAEGPAGLALGLLCLKPQLLPVWAVALLAARRWRALAGLGASALALAAISTVMAGPGWIGDWIALSRDSVARTTGPGFDAAYSHNFKELIALIPGVGAPGAITAQLGIAVGVIMLVAWLWWRAPAAGLPTAAGGRLIALTVLAMLLAAPVLNTHDLTFWVVAAAFLLAPAPDAAPHRRAPLALLCGLGWLLPWPAVAYLLISPIKVAAVYMLALSAFLLRDLLARPRLPRVQPALLGDPP